MPSEYTISVVLTEDLKRRVEDRAREDTTSISAIVRQALKVYFLVSGVTMRNGQRDVRSQEDIPA